MMDLGWGIRSVDQSRPIRPYAMPSQELIDPASVLARLLALITLEISVYFFCAAYGAIEGLSS